MQNTHSTNMYKDTGSNFSHRHMTPTAQLPSIRQHKEYVPKAKDSINMRYDKHMSLMLDKYKDSDRHINKLVSLRSDIVNMRAHGLDGRGRHGSVQPPTRTVKQSKEFSIDRDHQYKIYTLYKSKYINNTYKLN